jgi:hypothetical protein
MALPLTVSTYQDLRGFICHATSCRRAMPTQRETVPQGTWRGHDGDDRSVGLSAAGRDTSATPMPHAGRAVRGKPDRGQGWQGLAWRERVADGPKMRVEAIPTLSRLMPAMLTC